MRFYPVPAAAPAPVEICTDGIDNDKDGKIDCADSDCLGISGCGAEGLSTTCSDGFDDDGDGFIDCADAECNGRQGPGGGTCQYPESNCQDNYDNDGDGLIDCNDPNCSGQPGCQVIPENCTNGIDDDGDGMIDCGDPDCLGQQGPGGCVCQATETTCNDGCDNDRDGLIDCRDPHCVGRTGPGGITCEATETRCTDGGDNDGDGLTDCADSDCASNPACQTAVCDSTTLYWDYAGPVTCATGFQCGLDGSVTPPVANCLPNSRFSSGVNYGPCGTGSACPFGSYCVSGACYPLCDPATNPACPTGDCLYVLTVGGTQTEWELCKKTDPCDPVNNTGCTSGRTCYLVDNPHCLTTSTANIAVGQPCQYIDDCVAGALCAGTCYDLCHPPFGVRSDCTSTTAICTNYGNALYGACM